MVQQKSRKQTCARHLEHIFLFELFEHCSFDFHKLVGHKQRKEGVGIRVDGHIESHQLIEEHCCMCHCHITKCQFVNSRRRRILPYRCTPGSSQTVRSVVCVDAFRPCDDRVLLLIATNLASLAPASSTVCLRSIDNIRSRKTTLKPETRTYFEYVENNIEFDGLLTSHGVIHSTGICDALQNDRGQDDEDAFCNVALLRYSHASSASIFSRDKVLISRQLFPLTFSVAL